MNCIRKLDELVTKYSETLDIIHNITPINLNEENTKFISHVHHGVEYNPQYSYTKNPDINLVKREMQALTFSSGIIQDIYSDYQDYILKTLKLIESVGDAQHFTKLSLQLFPPPRSSLLKEAMQILNANPSVSLNDVKYDASHLEQVFQQQLEKEGFHWTIILKSPLSSKVAVAPDEKKIYINEDARFSENDIKRLLVHEIGTHVLRAENGSKQKYGIFKTGFPGSIETEEGLALYNERKYGVLDKGILKIYAGRVLATSLCANNSFNYSFLELSKYFSEEEAVRMVSRVKRGITDTSLAGGFFKDNLYLSGYLKMQNAVTPAAEKILYTGIIGLNDIDRVSALIKQKDVITF